MACGQKNSGPARRPDVATGSALIIAQSAYGPTMKLTFAFRRPSFRFPSIRLGLRTQIMMLGLAGVAVIGTFYLLGRQFEDRSRVTEEKFATLTTLTSKLSESLLQARQVATEFLQKPNDKKTALHEQILQSAAGYLARIEPMV